MKLTSLFFILTITLADIAIHGTDATSQDELQKYDNYDNDKALEPFSFRNVRGDRLIIDSLRPRKRARRLTCKRVPRVCRAKGSPGPKCCKKKCVDLLTDRRNCGKCGKKCKYNKICCNGKCVNPSFNKTHCGGCNNSCGNGGLCAFGLCSYA